MMSRIISPPKAARATRGTPAAGPRTKTLTAPEAVCESVAHMSEELDSGPSRSLRNRVRAPGWSRSTGRGCRCSHFRRFGTCCAAPHFTGVCTPSICRTSSPPTAWWKALPTIAGPGSGQARRPHRRRRRYPHRAARHHQPPQTPPHREMTAAEKAASRGWRREARGPGFTFLVGNLGEASLRPAVACRNPRGREHYAPGVSRRACVRRSSHIFRRGRIVVDLFDAVRLEVELDNQQDLKVPVRVVRGVREWPVRSKLAFTLGVVCRTPSGSAGATDSTRRRIKLGEPPKCTSALPGVEDPPSKAQ